jgi:hypothetical protein
MATWDFEWNFGNVTFFDIGTSFLERAFFVRTARLGTIYNSSLVFCSPPGGPWYEQRMVSFEVVVSDLRQGVFWVELAAELVLQGADVEIDFGFRSGRGLLCHGRWPFHR